VARFLYTRWDDTQPPFSLEADALLDELSRYLMEGLDATSALEWMRARGFELAGMEFRVLGLEELARELRARAQELLSRYNLDRAFEELRERLERALGKEERELERRFGVESARWNEFRARRDSLPGRLSEALERFRDHEWADAAAEAEYRELLELLEEARALEEFAARNRSRLRGPQSLGFEEALDLMRRVESLARLARDLLEGNLEALSPEELAEWLGEEGARSILILRTVERDLERAGYLRSGEGGPELTPRAIRRIGELALEDIYAALRSGPQGGHPTRHAGYEIASAERTRPYEFGRPGPLDAIGTLRNALRRRAALSDRPAAAPASRPDRHATSFAIRLEPGDLEVFDADRQTETTTVLLLDMSWSMSWSGRFASAKRVAIALDHLIRTRFPRDRFFVVGFYTRARELDVRELAELSWNASDPFTNLQEALVLAERLIDRHPSGSPQVIVITDGQPTAYFVEGELRVEWPSGFGGSSPRANRETLRQVRRITRKGVTINTFMLDDSPELLRFVEQMTRANRGRALYTSPGRLGECVMVDYLAGRKRRLR
jgi:uncharacterized protein with von Willebrand factor type A (vWA) domain